jgi:hypothetical protein
LFGRRRHQLGRFVFRGVGEQAVDAGEVGTHEPDPAEVGDGHPEDSQGGHVARFAGVHGGVHRHLEVGHQVVHLGDRYSSGEQDDAHALTDHGVGDVRP